MGGQVLDNHRADRLDLEAEEHLRTNGLHSRLNVEGQQGEGEQQADKDENYDLGDQSEVHGHQREREQVVDRNSINSDSGSKENHRGQICLVLLKDVHIYSLSLRSLDVKGIVEVSLENHFDGHDRRDKWNQRRQEKGLESRRDTWDCFEVHLEGVLSVELGALQKGQ